MAGEGDDIREFELDPLPVRLRIEALGYIVNLTGAERGPDCKTWDEFKVWVDDTAKWLEEGKWTARETAQLKPIKGGRNAAQAPSGQ